MAFDVKSEEAPAGRLAVSVCVTVENLRALQDVREQQWGVMKRLGSLQCLMEFCRRHVGPLQIGFLVCFPPRTISSGSFKIFLI